MVDGGALVSGSTGYFIFDLYINILGVHLLFRVSRLYACWNGKVHPVMIKFLGLSMGNSCRSDY